MPPGETASDGGIEPQAALEERAPGKPNGHELCGRGEHGRRGLCGGEDEADVRATALPRRAGCPSRGFGHRGRIRIQAEHQRLWLQRRALEDGPAVPGPDVHRHPGGPSDEVGDLADIHLGDPAANDEASHALQDTTASGLSPAARRQTGARTACTR